MSAECAVVLRASSQTDLTLCTHMQALSQEGQQELLFPLPSKTTIQAEEGVPIHHLRLVCGLWTVPSCLSPPAAATEQPTAGTQWLSSRNGGTAEEAADTITIRLPA